MRRRRKRNSPVRLIILFILVGGMLYFNQFIMPSIPPPFIPTATPTRSPESFIAEAQTLQTEGKLNQAIQAYQQAVQSDPKNPSVYIELARLQVYTGLYKEAVSNAENALLLNPNNATAHAIRGWALTQVGEYLPAEAAIKRAIELDQNSAAAYAYYAELIVLQSQAGQSSLGAMERAAEISRKAKELGPNDLEAHRARGMVLEQTANYAEAVQEFEAAVAINSNIADLHLALGRNYRALEQYDKAVEEFNKAIFLNPSDPMPYTYISRTYATVGEYAKAIQFAQQAVKASPTDAYMYGNLGSMYYRNRAYPEAVTNLRMAVRGGKSEDGEAVEGLPLDYGRIAEYYYTYGLALARTGQCGEALQISQVLSQGVPQDETATYNAQEMINICQQQVSGAATPAGAETPEAEGTPQATGEAAGTPGPTAAATQKP